MAYSWRYNCRIKRNMNKSFSNWWNVREKAQYCILFFACFFFFQVAAFCFHSFLLLIFWKNNHYHHDLNTYRILMNIIHCIIEFTLLPISSDITVFVCMLFVVFFFLTCSDVVFLLLDHTEFWILGFVFDNDARDKSQTSKIFKTCWRFLL